MPVYSGIDLVAIECLCMWKHIDRVCCVPIVAYVLRELCKSQFFYASLDDVLVDLS